MKLFSKHDFEFIGLMFMAAFLALMLIAAVVLIVILINDKTFNFLY